MPSTNADRSNLLRDRAHAFCKALHAPPAPRELLSQFFVDPSSSHGAKPTIFEHGPHWAASTRLPFLGKPFVGVENCEKYFETLGQTLKMHLDEHSFPGVEGFVVDLEADAVAGGRVLCATGGAHAAEKHHHLWEPVKKVAGGLLWHGSGNSENPNHGLKGTVTVVGKGTFESVKTGRKWDEEFVYVLGGWDEEGRFERWEIWADPLSAWVAVGEGEVEGWAKGEFAKGESVKEL